jgi:hypothetical protein
MYCLQLWHLADAHLRGQLSSLSLKVWEYDILETQIIAAIEWLKTDETVPYLINHVHTQTLHDLLRAFRTLNDKRLAQ